MAKDIDHAKIKAELKESLKGKGAKESAAVIAKAIRAAGAKQPLVVNACIGASWDLTGGQTAVQAAARLAIKEGRLSDADVEAVCAELEAL